MLAKTKHLLNILTNPMQQPGEKIILTEVQEYYNKTIAELGVTEDNNYFELEVGVDENQKSVMDDATGTWKKFIRKFPVFTCGEKGVDILVADVYGNKLQYVKTGTKFTRDYIVTRLQKPIVKADGSVQKYDIPGKVPVRPFFPPAIINKFRTKTKIKNLYFTEGYKKAFKASIHNIDCVAFISITTLKDKETGEIHPEILELIKDCQVERLIWLTDGDCRDIKETTLKWTENKNGREIASIPSLSDRPHVFFDSVVKFYNLTSQLENVERYFSHIDSQNIPNKPKGLDDLLIELPNEQTEIANELNNFSKVKNQLTFTYRINITFGLSKVQKYFFLDDVTLFYLHHVELHPTLKDRQFKFYGSTYKYDEKENKCLIQVPRDANRFKRIGDTYFELQKSPTI